MLRLAKSFRKNATDHERKLWQDLKRLDNCRFRRQVVIDSYIVDFACYQTRTIIELDGGQHAMDEHKAKDDIRDAYLKTQGFKVLRFWNFDTELERDGIIDAIQEHIGAPLPLDGGAVRSVCMQTRRAEGVIAPKVNP